MPEAPVPIFAASAKPDPASPPRVGVVGAGQMGLGIALSAARSGFQVCVRDVDPAREELAQQAGLGVALDCAQLAAQSDVIFVVVLDAGQIDHVLGPPGGLLAHLDARHTLLLCSTIAPGQAAAFAQRVLQTGAQVLDAPISGGPARAQAGTMSMMLAGASATVARLEPLLAAISARRFVISEHPGDAAKAKLVNNLMAGIHLMAGAEAIALAERLQLDPVQMAALIAASSGQSWMFEDRIPRALAGDFAPRAQAHVLTKDLRLANQAAADAGLSLPLGAVAAQMLQATCDQGWRDEDDAAALKYYRQRFSS